MPLERVLARETLVAVSAWERLHCQVYAFVALEVVISVEALRALVAPEGAIVWRRLMRGRLAVHVSHACGVAAACKSRHHAVGHGAADQRKLSVGVAHVGENGSVNGIVAVRSLVRQRRVRGS